MTVTAKVKCYSKTQTGDNAFSLQFSANYTDDNGNRINEDWAVATPALSVGMTVNATAAEHFEQGKSYTLVFEPEE